MIVENTGQVAFLKLKKYKLNKVFLKDSKVLFDFDISKEEAETYWESEFLIYKKELDSVKQVIRSYKLNKEEEK